MQQEPGQQLGRAAAAFVDLRAGVPAPQAADGDAEPGQRAARAADGQDARDADAPGAADGQDAFILRVEIDEGFAPQAGRVQRSGAEETCLLICCENGLQGRVGQGRVLQNGQDHGNGDAVVRAEGRPIGGEPVALQLQVQRVFGEIKVAARQLFADHIQVPLQNDRVRRLVAWGGRLADDDIILLVPRGVQAVGLGKLHTIGADACHIAGAARDPAELFKVIKDPLGGAFG